MASPLTKCDPHAATDLGTPPREHPKGPPEPSVLFRPGFGTLPFPGRPFIRLPESEGGGPGPEQSGDARRRDRDTPVCFTVSRARSGGGIFATVPTVQTRRPKSEEGSTGQDQAQGSRFSLFTGPACSQQRDAGGNVRGQSGGAAPSRGKRTGHAPAEGALAWPGARGAPGRPERTPACVGWLTAWGVSSREARCSCTRCKDPPLGRSGVGHQPADRPRGSIPNPPPDGCAQRWTAPSSSLQRLPRACPRPGSWESVLPTPLFGWGPMPPTPPGPGVQHCTWH